MIVLSPRPGLVCLHADRRAAHALYHIRNNADVPIRIRHSDSDRDVIVYASASCKLRWANKRINGHLEVRTVQWSIDGAPRLEFDGAGDLIIPYKFNMDR